MPSYVITDRDITIQLHGLQYPRPNNYDIWLKQSMLTDSNISKSSVWKPMLSPCIPTMQQYYIHLPMRLSEIIQHEHLMEGLIANLWDVLVSTNNYSLFVVPDKRKEHYNTESFEINQSDKTLTYPNLFGICQELIGEHGDTSTLILEEPCDRCIIQDLEIELNEIVPISKLNIEDVTDAVLLLNQSFGARTVVGNGELLHTQSNRIINLLLDETIITLDELLFQGQTYFEYIGELEDETMSDIAQYAKYIGSLLPGTFVLDWVLTNDEAPTLVNVSMLSDVSIWC